MEKVKEKVEVAKIQSYDKYINHMKSKRWTRSALFPSLNLTKLQEKLMQGE